MLDAGLLLVLEQLLDLFIVSLELVNFFFTILLLILEFILAILQAFDHISNLFVLHLHFLNLSSALLFPFFFLALPIVHLTLTNILIVSLPLQ